MIRTGLLCALLLASAGAFAAGAGDLTPSGANVHDTASLQRGAAVFANYCHACHSAQYVRYQRLAQDLDLSEDEVAQYLMFGEAELTDYMVSTISGESATEWFGAPAPDLTLVARYRGGDWLYSFLHSFYMTDQGWNNTILPNAAMPHVLWELQGIQRPIIETYVDPYGDERTRVVNLELDQPGLMSPIEYDRFTRDLTAFMIYMSEPAVLKRERMGIWVILFLGLFTFLSYLMYKEYWKDVRK